MTGPTGENEKLRLSIATDKLVAIGVSPNIAEAKVKVLLESPDLITLKTHCKETGLGVYQFLSLLFKGLFPQITEEVTKELEEFRLSPKMLENLFVKFAGEPYILFGSEYPEAISESEWERFKEKTNYIMLQKLRKYIL